MVRQFENKVALVTGGSSGIGRATALAFAREGAKVAVADVLIDGGDQTVQMIKEGGGDSLFIRTDVSEAAEVGALIRAVVERCGQLNYAFNNAGTEGTLAPTADYPEEIWNRVLAIDLTGLWLCMKHEIPQMLNQGGGVIVNMASVLGMVGFANSSAYVAAKHGVIGLTKVAALEYAVQGIRVNAVCPGFIETPMNMERGLVAGANPEVYRQICDLHPVKRMGKPEEIAQAVLWLCSDAASFVTGHAMILDGGYLAQ